MRPDVPAATTAWETYRFDLPHIQGLVRPLDLGALRSREAELLSLLSPADKERLRPLSGAARLRSLAGMATGREELARRLSLKPADVHIARTPYGKPFLASGERIHFNISHCERYLMCVISDRHPVGADVETPRKYPASVAERFSCAEKEMLAASSKPERPKAFARLWAAKEACVKCRGQGSISRVETSLAAEGTWRGIHWRRIEPAEDFVAVVAARLE